MAKNEKSGPKRLKWPKLPKLITLIELPLIISSSFSHDVKKLCVQVLGAFVRSSSAGVPTNSMQRSMSEARVFQRRTFAIYILMFCHKAFFNRLSDIINSLESRAYAQDPQISQ